MAGDGGEEVARLPPMAGLPEALVHELGLLDPTPLGKSVVNDVNIPKGQRFIDCMWHPHTRPQSTKGGNTLLALIAAGTPSRNLVC